jgi:hypothetical protein
MKLGDMATAVGKGLFVGAAGPLQCHSQARFFAHRNGLALSTPATNGPTLTVVAVK